MFKKCVQNFLKLFPFSRHNGRPSSGDVVGWGPGGGADCGRRQEVETYRGRHHSYEQHKLGSSVSATESKLDADVEKTHKSYANL